VGLGRNAAEKSRKLTGWIFLLGAIIYFVLEFQHFQASHLRIPGVLQRIGLCYLLASTIVLFLGVTGRTIWTIILLGGYWWLVKYVHPPASFVDHLPADRYLGRLHEWIDLKVLGLHLYRERPDPEGILSTIPAVATVLIGVLAGDWLHTYREKRDHVLGLFFGASLLIVAGLWWNHEFPINKKIWTSSYVLFAAGVSMQMLAVCYFLIDIKGYRAWAWPFLVVGTNAIAIYFAAGIGARILMRMIKVTENGNSISIWGYLYHRLASGVHYIFPSVSPEALSALGSLIYLSILCILLIPLYRRRIFIRV
jgi:predicted acyltransferase